MEPEGWGFSSVVGCLPGSYDALGSIFSAVNKQPPPINLESLSSKDLANQLNSNINILCFCNSVKVFLQICQFLGYINGINYKF
jgi:hypothetical protein